MAWSLYLPNYKNDDVTISLKSKYIKLIFSVIKTEHQIYEKTDHIQVSLVKVSKFKRNN